MVGLPGAARGTVMWGSELSHSNAAMRTFFSLPFIDPARTNARNISVARNVLDQAADLQRDSKPAS